MSYIFSNLSGYLEQLKESLHIGVIHGGDKRKPGAVLNKTHNPRSWKSYEAVAGDIAGALRELGFKHVFVFPDDMTLFSSLKNYGIHMAWLNTGGVQGYIPTAHAASMLEMCGIPYVGHNPQNAAILDNKHIFKFMLHKFGVPTSPFIVWSRSSLTQSVEADLREIEETFGDYTGPFVVKPVSGRASLHVTFVDSLDDLEETVDEIHKQTRNHILIEKYIPGREFCVSFCGPVVSRGGELTKRPYPFGFSFLERVLEPDERIFTSMDTRPITNNRIRLCGGEEEEKLIKGLSALGRSIYTRFFLETLVRVDIRADKEGHLFVLETNPKPDLKKPVEEVTSLTCSGLSRQNMDYNDLILSLLADRLDYLLTYRKKSIRPILGLLG